MRRTIARLTPGVGLAAKERPIVDTTATERFHDALSGGMSDRVPVLPKIWLDLAAVLTGTEFRALIEDPAAAMRVVVEAALAVDADAARLFFFPKRRTRLDGDTLVEVDASGEAVGPIDTQGGFTTRLADSSRFRLDDPYRIAFLTCWSAHEPLVRDRADVDRIAVPDRAFYESQGFDVMVREMLAMAGDRLALVGDCGSATLAFTVLLRQMSDALVDLLERPELVDAMMAKGVEIAVERGKFLVDCGLRFLRLNDSVANASVISPRLWRRFVLPAMQTFCRELHLYDTDVRIYSHVCGNALPMMDAMVETGVDCIGPLDPLGGFTCADARRVVGRRAALMGGVNTLSFVNNTPNQIVEEARRCIDGAGREGGYVLGSGCALPRTSSRENLLALSQAAREYGVYADR